MPGTTALRSPTYFATVIAALWQGTIAAILTASASIPCPIVVRRSDPVRRSVDATGLRLGYGLPVTEREIATHPPLSMLRQHGPADRTQWPRRRSGRGADRSGGGADGSKYALRHAWPGMPRCVTTD